MVEFGVWTRVRTSGRVAGLAITFLGLAASLAPTEVNAQIRCWTNASGSRECSDLPPPSDAKAISDIRGRAGRIDGQESFSQRQASERFPVVFWSNDCGEPCNNARKLLTSRGIPFADRNPAQQDLQDEFRRLTKGQMQVPLLLVGSTQLTGFEETQWNSTLDAAGYSRTPTGPRRPAPVATIPRPGTPPAGGPAFQAPPGPGGGLPPGAPVQTGPGGVVVPPQNTGAQQNAAPPGTVGPGGQPPGFAQVPGTSGGPGSLPGGPGGIPGGPGGPPGGPGVPGQNFTPAGPAPGANPGQPR